MGLAVKQGGTSNKMYLVDVQVSLFSFFTVKTLKLD